MCLLTVYDPVRIQPASSLEQPNNSVEGSRITWHHYAAACEPESLDTVTSRPVPLGSLQMWCRARQSAQPIWNALPSAATAMHMEPFHGNHLSYTTTRSGPGSDLRPLYATLARKYRMLIFSGDADVCVPYTGSAEWTYGLGFQVTKDWRPWSAPLSSSVGGAAIEGRVGYVIGFGGDSKSFAFATVNNAGHEVPTFQPRAAKALISRFLANQPL